MSLSGTERKRKIIDFLADDSNLSATKISELLEVSPVTIRNDLSSLAEEGLIVRTHGGALPAFHPSIVARQKSMMEEKNRIARAAAGLVSDGDKIMTV